MGVLKAEMPKKFKEVNSKSVAAKERKAASKREAEEKRKQEEEDEYWRDDDKYVMKKQERKADRDRRRQEQLERKVESRKLLVEEEATLKSKSPSGATKMTTAQILEAQEQERHQDGETALPRRVTENPPLLENPNRIMEQRAMEGLIDAQTIDEAIEILGDEKGSKERHPERRLKAAYAEFEELNLPKLKEENPNLRMSQLKQLLRKEWMKSPDNPMNQHHLSYNSKS